MGDIKLNTASAQGDGVGRYFQLQIDIIDAHAHTTHDLTHTQVTSGIEKTIGKIFANGYER